MARQLHLSDLTDQHLLLMQRAAVLAPQPVDWIADIAENRISVYEVSGGIIGLRKEPKQVFVEFLAGRDMRPHTKEILQAVRALAKGPVEGFVVSPALVRFYKKLGFSPVGTYVRLEG